MFQRFLLPLLLMVIIEKVISQNSVPAMWDENPQMKTGIVQMVNYTLQNPPSCFNKSLAPKSYSITYSGNPLATTNSAGIGIVGFHLTFSVDFSVNITIDNFTSTSLRITMATYGDTNLCMYTINWIVIGNGIYFAEIQYACTSCPQLNTSFGFRSQTATGKTKFVGYPSLDVRTYLSGFWLRNTIGLTNYLEVHASIPSYSNIINYVFQTSQNNTVSQICYTTIIFCNSTTQPSMVDYVNVGQLIFNNSNMPVSYPINYPQSSNPPSWLADNNTMFFGINQFNVSRGIDRFFLLDTNPCNPCNSCVCDSMVYQTNYGTFFIGVNFFWQIQRNCSQYSNTSSYWFWDNDRTCNANCTQLSNITQYYSSNSYNYCATCNITCQDCLGPGYNQCISCNSSLFRIPGPINNDTINCNISSSNCSSCNCNPGYVDIGQALCYPCSTFIIGCDTCNNTTICNSCVAGFILQNNICFCQNGFLVSGVCTNITGCIVLILSNGQQQCIQCDESLNFEINLNNNTCSCSQGYRFNTSNYGVCYSICGDGFQTINQACDDGNNVSGDGCSSTCTIEDNWMCINGSVTSPSVCYIDTEFSLSVLYVRRITNANQMQVGFQLSPKVPQLSLINFQKYISTNVPATSYNVSYQNGVMKVIFNYNQTIQGNSYYFTLDLDPDYFNNIQLTTIIPASGMNAKLTFDKYNSINRPLQIIVIVLDCLALIILFASCVSQRMIGIQMIQTLQTVLYTQVAMNVIPSSFTPLQMLRYASGYNQIQGIDHGRTYSLAFSLSSVGLQKQFMLSFNLMYIGLVIVILACLLLKVKQLYHEKQLEKLRKDNYQKDVKKLGKTVKIFNFLFQRVLFVAVFMSMFLIIFALMIQLTDQKPRYIMMPKQFNLLSAIIAISILITMICAVVLNGLFPGTLLFPMLMKQHYPPIYFIYQSAFIFLLAFDFTQHYILFVLAFLSFGFLIYNAVGNLYPERFHTYVLVFHQLLIMGVIGIWIFQNHTTPTEHQSMYKIANFVIIFLLYCVVGLNAYRLYRYYQYLKNKGWDQYGNSKDAQDLDRSDLMTYKNFSNPSDMKTGRRYDDQNKTKKGDDASKKGKNKNDLQVFEMKNMQPVKKYNSPQFNWQYNKLSKDNDNNRLQRPTRGDNYNSQIGKNSKNKQSKDKLNKQPDDVSQINQRSYQQQAINRDNSHLTPIKPSVNQIKEQDPHTNQDNDNIFDTPYDQNGFPKQRTKNNRQQFQDPLSAIKKRYKKDYSQKIKVSTLKQK